MTLEEVLGIFPLNQTKARNMVERIWRAQKNGISRQDLVEQMYGNKSSVNRSNIRSLLSWTRSYLKEMRAPFGIENVEGRGRLVIVNRPQTEVDINYFGKSRPATIAMSDRHDMMLDDLAKNQSISRSKVVRDLIEDAWELM